MERQSVNYDELLYVAMDGSEVAYNELVTSFVQENRYYFYKTYASLQREEVDSLMRLAIINAIESYNMVHGASVATYFSKCIKNILSTACVNQSKFSREIDFEADKLQYIQHKSDQNIATVDTLSIECQDFIEQLNTEQEFVFHALLAGQSVRTIASELNISRTKVNTIREILKSKAKQYGLVEKNF